jgi:hypothetical protein
MVVNFCEAALPSVGMTTRSARQLAAVNHPQAAQFAKRNGRPHACLRTLTMAEGDDLMPWSDRP